MARAKRPARISFAGQLAVEARQADGEGLQGAHGIVVVQGEDVLGYSAKLHDNVVGCRVSEESRQCINHDCLKKKKEGTNSKSYLRSLS